LGLPLLALGVVFVLALFIANQNRTLESRLADVKQEIASLEPVVARVKVLDQQIALNKAKEQRLADLMKGQLPAASVLNEFRLLIPKDVWVTGLTVPDSQALSIEGLALNYLAVAQLMDNLAAGQLFRQVDLTLVQLDHVGSREVVKYQVTARIQKPQAGGDRP
jgi:Tfp pilus assembly protein PilN